MRNELFVKSFCSGGESSEFGGVVTGFIAVC